MRAAHAQEARDGCIHLQTSAILLWPAPASLEIVKLHAGCVPHKPRIEGPRSQHRKDDD